MLEQRHLRCHRQFVEGEYLLLGLLDLRLPHAPLEGERVQLVRPASRAVAGCHELRRFSNTPQGFILLTNSRVSPAGCSCA